MRPHRISYRTIFNYAVKHWGLGWNRCHQVFLKTGALEYDGITESIYVEDLEADVENECGIVGWSGEFLLANQIILSYLRATGNSPLKVYHS